MALFVMLVSLLGVVVGANFTNPVIGEDFPDPGVLYWQGEFFMVTTSNNGANAFAIHKSKNLVQWSPIGYVFPQGSWPSWAKSDFWAPELHQLGDGSLNVYFTARTAGGLLSVSVAKSTTGRPEGPYKDRGSPIITNPVGVIDPSFFRDDDGRQYLITKVDGNSQGKPTPINIQQLDASGLNFESGSQERTILDFNLPWEGNLVEGPWMIKKDGYYYLFYSSNGYTSSWYSVGVARSRALTGPFEKAVAPTLSQFVGNSANAWEGPGHCSVLQNVGPSNATIMIYHAWTRGRSGQAPGRLVLADRVTWTNDGWAMTGDSYTPSTLSTFDPLGDGRPQSRVEVGGTYVFRALQFPNNYWCYDGTINCMNSFIVRNGLAGGNTFSFEATSRPGYFMRHFAGKLRLDPLASDTVYHSDASFMVLSGAASVGGVSFRPVNFPDNLIRHKNGVLEINSPENNDGYRNDATFVAVRA